MRILFVGGGNMAAALIGGLLKRGFSRDALRVVEVSEPARQRLQQTFGVLAIAALDEAIAEEVVLLAVKPQHLRLVAENLRPHLRGQLVITIAAGIRTSDLKRWLHGHGRLVRAMPNTPALIGSGVTGLFAPDSVEKPDRDRAQEILGAVGGVIWVQSESDMDTVTAISGSGPAYVFYFIEALERAAVELGLQGDQAHSLAIQTFVGAAKLAAGSDEPVTLLRERVTSKAGTTEAAVHAMEASTVKDRIVEAVHAAARRSRELGDQLGKDQTT